jgi:hypothetical protein
MQIIPRMHGQWASGTKWKFSGAVFPRHAQAVPAPFPRVFYPFPRL